ncbi:MAG: phenylalanine--tRNA ligase subunit beta [Gemmatimonadota bacterium]
MNISRRWLEAFLRRPLDAQELARILPMLGAPVDAIEPIHSELGPFVVGRVLEVGPHPDPKATKVRLTVVDDGSGERLAVICGAPNVTAGKSYPFARLGTRMPGPKGFTIEARPIRGVVSQGMLCSARELGLGEEHNGILELDTDAAPGTPLLEVMPIDDDRLVIDVTPNRPDLLGHKGVARELASALKTPFRLPLIPGSEGATAPNPRRAEGQSGVTGGVTITIEDPEGCARFFAATLRGVTVGPSPAWLQQRVTSVGMRSINNVVDATNYVMFELNQPMHAYDLAKLAGPALIARRARPGEKLVTLDDVERTLDQDMVVIADAERAVGIAGVMGAAQVEVTAQTTDLVLECAWFDPRRTRRARRSIGLSSEASHRFERGVDRWGGAEPMRRCIEIIQATGGGALDGEPVDVWPTPTNPPRIFLRPARSAQVLGVDLPVRRIEECLVAIGCTVLAKPDDHRIAVDVPGWRPDLVSEIDLIEEVARVHGYGEFPDELRPYRVPVREDAIEARATRRVREGLVAEGLFESQTLAFGPAGDKNAVALINPMAAPEGWLRTSLVPGLLRQVEHNWSAHTRDIRLFEIGTTFHAAPDRGRPIEVLRVAGLISGGREPGHWTASGKAPDFELWDLKGLLARAVALAVPGGTCQVEGSKLVARSPESGFAGWGGLVDQTVPPWAAPVFGFELTISLEARSGIRYTPLPTTPAVERDVALVLPAGVTADAVRAAIITAGDASLESVAAFDEYRGKGLMAGTRSVAFRLVFRDPVRTLRDQDVDSAVTKALAALESSLGVQLRTT